MAQVQSNKIFKIREIQNDNNALKYCMIFLLFSAIILTTVSIYSFGCIVKTGYGPFDIGAINYVYFLRSKLLNMVLIAVTTTGNPLNVFIITVAVSTFLYYVKMRKESIFFTINILGIWLLNEGIKAIVKRPRPSVIRLVHASGYSFPSGHSMVFMTCSLLLIFFILYFLKNKCFSYFSCSLIFFYTIAVGLSRVYVGVHYISDVLAGWAFATVWALISISVYKYILESNSLYSKKI